MHSGFTGNISLNIECAHTMRKFMGMRSFALGRIPDQTHHVYTMGYPDFFLGGGEGGEGQHIITIMVYRDLLGSLVGTTVTESSVSV